MGSDECLIMNPTTQLILNSRQPLTACNAGLFISRGKGIHPERVIDSYELIFVRKGRLDMEEEGRPLVAEAGQTLLLWPGRRHRGTQWYPHDLSFYWIHFQLTPNVRGVSLENIIVPQQSMVRRPDRLAELYHRFLDDQETGLLRSIPAALLIRLMLCEAADVRPLRAEVASAIHVLAERAESFVNEHFQSNIHTDEIACELRCNPDYLGRIFRRIKGVTLTDFIHRRRLQEARLLLRESALNIDQVARECGFQEVGYFRRIFQRHEGMTPLAYRRLHVRMHINIR